MKRTKNLAILKIRFNEEFIVTQEAVFGRVPEEGEEFEFHGIRLVRGRFMGVDKSSCLAHPYSSIFSCEIKEKQ